MYKVEKIIIRAILNSNGEYAVESDVYLKSGYGRASAPAAILAGRRENAITYHIKEKIDFFNHQVQILTGNRYNQKLWDEVLVKKSKEWGSDITLALSLAFARAVSQSEKQDLVSYIREQNIVLPVKKAFSPMIPIFSGGVHDQELGGSMQQIMLSILDVDFVETVDTILYLYNMIEKTLIDLKKLKGYSASSGFLTNHLNLDDKFYMLADIIHKTGNEKNISIAIDVAAEHLRTDDSYYFQHKLISADEMESLLFDLTRKYPLIYIEDPFDARDIDNWNSLYQKVGSHTYIFSDDLSATQVKYLDNAMIHGAIIKMKQVGTLTGTLEMVNQTRKKGLLNCVSHRSYETEDTFMCDLGVAIETDYMKIGGPRRGDRVEKYNRLLRIFESIK